MNEEIKHEVVTPKSDKNTIIEAVQKIIEKIKGNPDKEVQGLVARTLARLLRQKREDNEI